MILCDLLNLDIIVQEKQYLPKWYVFNSEGNHGILG